MAYIRDWTVTDVVNASTNPASQVRYPVHATNDILLLYLCCDGTNLPSLPSGYADIQNQVGAAQTYRLCYKIAASSSETCPTLTLSAGDEWHITVIAVAGADYADPINVTAERTVTDNTSPFTWSHGQSTDETNVLVFQFINSDTGLAITANPPWTNLQNGDAGSAGGSVAYMFLPAIGAIPNCDWRGRANDDTTACLVGINDDGNGTRPAYADQTSVGQLLRLLHAGTIESDTFPATLTFASISVRNFTQVWAFDGTSTYTDETTDLRDAGTGDVTISNAIGAIWYFGYDYTFRSMVLDVGTAQAGGTIVWEYWNGSTWTSFTPTGVLTATGHVRLNWTTLSGWASTSVNSVDKYYVRMRVSATFTTAPVLDEGHVGGYLTTYDASAAAGDAGINPYQDAMSLTPGSTVNFSGPELQFGSALDMDTGIVILHHKSQLPRDYAVDVAVNDVTYPVTDIVNGLGGFLAVFADADGDYEAYSIHGKGALSNSITDWNVAAIGINDGAQAYGIVRDALNKSAVTRMLLLPQGQNGAMLAYVSQLSIVQKLVVAGGSSSQPISNNDLVFVANRAFGQTLLFNGIGTYYRVYCPLEIGGGDPVYLNIDGITYAMPTKFDGKLYFDWNANDNVAGWKFYGKTGDQIKFTNCIWNGSQPYRWEFNSSHVAGTENFTGCKVQGATVTLVSTVALDRVSFVNCPTFTLGGATLTNCTFTSTKVSAASPGDADNISDSAFTSGGTGHALEISGTAANMTLDGVTFSGYASSDGSTGNEAIYVNIASGSMTISITGGGSTPSIRTAGATVTVQNAVTVKVTVRDVNTNSVIENARVLVEKVSDGTDILTGLTNSSGIASTTWAYPGDTAVTGKVRRASATYGTLYKTSPISATITSSGLDITVLLIPDE